MFDLRKVWNFGSLAFGFLFPFLLGAFESTLRGAAGDNDPQFFLPALAAAGLAALLPCFSVGPRPEPAAPGESTEAARRRWDYNWNAGVLLLAGGWFIVGSLLWAVILVHSIKGTLPVWWPEFTFNKAIGVSGSETLAFYVPATMLAIAKLVKP
ncbi:hypothetical protein B0G76_6712 [Paraburkholderia sp. BL23I1N1]|uniref:hypothetical protein n=1 Tax=Paraburkholderia sp. BL23I1N1 TaxID=1938802 RepID=UPI000E77276F|nr:hypothetical protein [Paraburkholderia sp. BL23I1N1]RKE25193.1 hypothetical protein B0G76_6712 [Paraburkholderia sp. BL23I1N1]